MNISCVESDGRIHVMGHAHCNPYSRTILRTALVASIAHGAPCSAGGCRKCSLFLISSKGRRCTPQPIYDHNETNPMPETIHSPCGLAFETWDDIIALLSSTKDLATLAACALTCHAFLPAARAHLFRVARLDSPARLAALETLLGASPALARSIRTLDVRGNPSCCGGSECGAEDDGQLKHCVKEGWLRLASRLKRLESVRLQGFALKPLVEVRQAGITNVWLKDMRGGGDDLRAFVLGCPQLTSLYIDDTGDVEQDPASVARMHLPYDSPPFRNLDTLVWHVPSLPLLMQSRQAVDAPTTLPLLVAHALESGCTIPLLRLAVGHNLRLSNATRSVAKQLVASAGDTLESLVLRLEDLGEGWPPEYIRNALLPELSENHRLKSLHILAVGSAWFEIHNGLSAITYVLSTIPAEQDALEDVVIHLTPYVPRSQQDWSVAAWVQLVDEIAALMHAHPRMKCTLCLDFSSNYGERPRPVDQRGIAEYVGKLVDAIPHRRSEEESVKLPPRISLIWQTHFRDWECEGDTYPERNYVGEAMGAPEWYYRLRYGAP